MAGYSNYRRDSAKYTSKINLFKVERNHRKNGESKTDKFNRQMHIWVAYYRANPHRFAKEFLGLNLHLFQAILLWGMMHHNIFMFIASRGIGSEYPRRRDKHGGIYFYAGRDGLHKREY